MSKLSDDPEKRARSLANLKPIRTAERAEELREIGLEKRRKQKEALENLKVSAKALEEAGALTVMRGLVQEYLMNQDYEGASKLLGQIAEYEQPKLQRQEVNQTVSTRELTDEELAEELKKLDEN